MKTGIVAIIGKPNVGKSSLFNRIIKKNISIIDDKPGVTRDRIYFYANWLTYTFLLIDTGGITEQKNIPFIQEIKIQSQIAINEADIILFLVSYYDGITRDDEIITKILYKTKKNIILVVNKYDKKDNNLKLYNFLSLGFGEPIAISSIHGIGIGDLLDKIIFFLQKKILYYEISSLNFAIIGQTNVGKSSLTNAILNEQRVIVSDIPGTTTDTIDIFFTRNKKKYTIIDTAGIKRKNKIYENFEKYSLLRTIKAIERSHIILLVIDGSIPIVNQDIHIGGLPYERKKPVIIIVNKLDKIIITNNQIFKQIEKKIKECFKYLNYAKIIFVSALKHEGINKLFILINNINQMLKKHIKTSILNEILIKIQLSHASSNFNGGKLKIYYTTQLKCNIPTFIMFCNNPKYVHFSYKRFIENQIRDYFDFSGIPINIIFKRKK